MNELRTCGNCSQTVLDGGLGSFSRNAIKQGVPVRQFSGELEVLGELEMTPFQFASSPGFTRNTIKEVVPVRRQFASSPCRSNF
jgi:hypothetical protein